MADDQQQQQQKQKGGGGGGATTGISFGGKLDPAQMSDETSLGKIITDQLIVAATAAIATVVMHRLCKIIRPAFGVKPQALPQGGGDNRPAHPGQLLGAINSMKSHPQMQQMLPKIEEALAAIKTPVQQD